MLAPTPFVIVGLTSPVVLPWQDGLRREYFDPTEGCSTALKRMWRFLFCLHLTLLK